MVARGGAFCNKTLKCSLDFQAVLAVVTGFLGPVYEAIIDNETFSGTWLKGRREWRRAKLENDGMQGVR